MTTRNFPKGGTSNRTEPLVKYSVSSFLDMSLKLADWQNKGGIRGGHVCSSSSFDGICKETWFKVCVVACNLYIRHLYRTSAELVATEIDNRLEGLAHKVLQWYLCRMEGWFATDSENISLKCWDEVWEFILPLFLHWFWFSVCFCCLITVLFINMFHLLVLHLTITYKYPWFC